jgi:hypothetical protein
MTDANRRKFIPPSDYYRSITKSYEKKKKKSAGSSDVPQLGAQKNQSIEPLAMLPTEQQGLIAFLGTSGLSAAQVAGRDEIRTHPGVAKWNYEFHKSLVPLKVVLVFPTEKRRLHDYYMLASSHNNCMLDVWIKDEDYFHGKEVMWLYFKELYQLYHQDALDISFVSTCLL